MIQIRLYNNQTSSLYFHWKNCIYSKCDWNPCPALIFQVTHQSFRRNGILHPSYSKTYQLTSVWIIQWAIHYPGLALCTEDKFHQQWTPCFSLESWESSQNNWEIFGASPSISLYWDKGSWPQWWMRTEVFCLLPKPDQDKQTWPQDVRFYFRRAEIYLVCFINMVRYYFSQQ